ncbi:heterokaryon incompatibility protein-domain-containing protein [Leptodontidium sp. MPI-SDFR-AT-0119]|nr:heterokaryon incompatibility protein-domain-containing protein [Leptodontidium sp. MPI-SDFR-AT-0119]
MSRPTSPVWASPIISPLQLRHLRYPDRERILWADAICINQTDDAERSREVLQMGSIYSNAIQVIVWLGPSEDDSTLALETLDRIGRGVDFDRRSFAVISEPGAWAEALETNAEMLKAESPRWVAIAKLIRRGWFHRLWVFQEISLATSSSVVAGECSIDWELFRLGLYWIWYKINDLNRLPGVPYIENPSTNSLHGLLNVSDRNVNTSVNFLSALDLTRKSLCSDKKDRLFAIQGLLPPVEQRLITPDYSLRTEEVYKATTTSCIDLYGRLALLPYCVLQSSPSDVELPSWVPDFSFQDAPEPISYSGAAGCALGSYSLHERDILVVQGVKVAEITEAWASNITQQSTNDELGKVWCDWGKQVSLSAAYVAGGHMDDALVETLLCGQTKENGPDNFGWSPSGEVYKDLLLAPENFNGETQDNRSDGPDRELVFPLSRRSVIGRAFFKTAEGYVGVCPESVKSRDYVVVILECDVPLVLRPDQDNRANFRIVGECYVPGIMKAEGILGHLPSGWTERTLISKDRGLIMVYEQGSMKTQRDPRASALPPGWRIMFGTMYYPLENEPEDERVWDSAWFMNEDTGETTACDPRLTPELLMKRGVDIREFRLV